MGICWDTKKVNDFIYRQINGINESAFLNILIIPIIAAVVACIILITILIIKFIG